MRPSAATAIAVLGSLAFAAAAPAQDAQPSAQAQPTLCTAGERVIFSAALVRSTKLVSLCGSPGDGDLPGAYVQYRFGRPGRVELEYPHDRAGSRQQFEHEAGGGRDKGLWFETNGFRYVISEVFPLRGEAGEPETTLSVYRAGGDPRDRPVATFTCRTPYRGGLADF